MAKESERRQIDWESVEKDFRAGLLSLREMSDIYGVSHVMIAKKAKQLGWARDLNARIQAKADELVNKAQVNEKVNAVNEKAIIDANAPIVAEVRMRHRRDIYSLLEKANEYQSELDACGEDLGKRVTILKAIADIKKTAIGLERQAFGIADTADGDKSPVSEIAEIVRKIIK